MDMRGHAYQNSQRMYVSGVFTYKLFTMIVVIPADYSGQLTTLLRYPSPTSANKIEGTPHHTVLLIRQALALQIAPIPTTGASIAMENRTFLNILLEVPTSSPASSMKRHTRPPLSSTGSEDSSPARGHSRQVSSPAIGISDMLTRGLVERGESLGINKTLLSAVTEIRVSILTRDSYDIEYLYSSGISLSLRHHWVSGFPVSLFHHFQW
jgi:hypothetical protein